MRKIIFLAPPAAGKGTQSQLLANKHDLVQISVGDLIREEIKKGNEDLLSIINSGKLVSDEIMVDLLKNKLASIDKGFILDGFPRSQSQAEILSSIIGSEPDFVFYLDISKEEAKKRITGRLTCPKCKRVYNSNIEELKPLHENLCDHCGTQLVKRTDDNEESFEKRYNTYFQETMPLVDYYKSKGVLVEVDSTKAKEEIFSSIEGAINE